MKSKLLIFLLLAGCTQCPEKVPPFTAQEFTGREERAGENLLARRYVYRAKVPHGWRRIDPEGSIRDTKVANVTFLIENELKITVHSFPSECLEERIPPSAQVERWKSQLGNGAITVTPVSHSGFYGLCLEGPALLAWSMQLDLEHYQNLSFLAASSSEAEHYKQMSADYTIKACGPQELIDRHKEEIRFFANNFELIQEIPKRS